ncbi:MAG: hypothetical protein ACREJ2_02035 [Planctomycetota bacterium]
MTPLLLLILPLGLLFLPSRPLAAADVAPPPKTPAVAPTTGGNGDPNTNPTPTDPPDPAGPPGPTGPAGQPTADADHADLYVEQTYNYASIDAGGQASRDVIQKMYIEPERIAIADSGETVIIDLKNKTVTTVHPDKKSYRTETFDQIRKRIDQRVALERKNYAAMLPGPQREQVYQTIKGYLDDEVTYSTEVKEMTGKDASGSFDDDVTITATRTHDGKTTTDTVLTAKLSRGLKLPFKDFDYAQALYYLELASAKMVEQLTGPRALLLPLQLHLELPTGGSVSSKVVKFTYCSGFDAKLFAPPAGYTDEDKQSSTNPTQAPKIDWGKLEQ